MRLCPAAPIVVRKLLEPMELGGYAIPAGTTVAPCVHLVHRRTDIYPDPLRFRPERFLERDGRDPSTHTRGSPSAAACGAVWRPATRNC